MKILRLALAIFLLLSLARLLPAASQEIKMIFWYPGEAGTTEEAQGVLDSFFDHLNNKITPYKISGKYFNTVPQGLAYLKKERPALGIISFAAYTMNGPALGKSEQILKTLPLPEGKTTEQYAIVGLGTRPPDWKTTLYTKQPLTGVFVDSHIVGARTNLEIVIVPNIIPTLKDVGGGTKKGGVILQPMEYQTLKAIKQPWARQLTVWHISAPVPSAPLLALQPLPADARQKITSALLSMPADPEGKKILETLRLKGFEN